MSEESQVSSEAIMQEAIHENLARLRCNAPELQGLMDDEHVGLLLNFMGKLCYRDGAIHGIRKSSESMMGIIDRLGQ